MGSTQQEILDKIDIENLSDEDFLSLAYLAIFERKVDEHGLRQWKVKIEEGTFDRRELLYSLTESPEFLLKDKDPLFKIRHMGRQKWIRTLDRFDTIFDIGGSSPNTELGAMIELGYTHRPRELVIFDLPPEKQYWAKPKFPQDREYKFEWGTVKYIHGNIAEIGQYKWLGDRRFDCIFMGQVIEHIFKSEVDDVLKWIWEHLEDDGRLILDTPNRAITSIESPDKPAFDYHRYEYNPDELEKILLDNGLQVVKKTGILDMPGTYLSKVYNPLEPYETRLVNDSPETSYLFAFECVKTERRPKTKAKKTVQAALDVEGYNEAAETFYKRFKDDPAITNRPFHSSVETPLLLYKLGLLTANLDIDTGHTVLDFAAGSCWISSILNRMGCRTIAIDVSPTALEIGKMAFGMDKRHKMHLDPKFLTYDGYRFPLEDASVDRIICFDAFHHVPNPQQILDEMYRVLKKGGRAGFVEPGPNHAPSADENSEMELHGLPADDFIVERFFDQTIKAGFTNCVILPYPLPTTVRLNFAEYREFLEGDSDRYPLDLIREDAKKDSFLFIQKGEDVYDSTNPR